MNHYRKTTAFVNFCVTTSFEYISILIKNHTAYRVNASLVCLPLKPTVFHDMLPKTDLARKEVDYSCTLLCFRTIA